jgi:hypothetical protein
VDIIKRLGYEEKDVLLAVYACQRRGGGEVMSLDAYIGDILDELATYEAAAAMTPPLLLVLPPTSPTADAPNE